MNDTVNDADRNAAKGLLSHRVLQSRTFWVSHLTPEGKGSASTSRGVRQMIRALAEGKVWDMPAFYVFESFATIDHIALTLRLQRKVKDVFLIGSFTHAECRIVGDCDDAVLSDLVPFAKRARQAPQPAKHPFHDLIAARRKAVAEAAKAYLGKEVSA